MQRFVWENQISVGMLHSASVVVAWAVLNALQLRAGGHESPEVVGHGLYVEDWIS